MVWGVVQGERGLKGGWRLLAVTGGCEAGSVAMLASGNQLAGNGFLCIAFSAKHTAGSVSLQASLWSSRTPGCLRAWQFPLNFLVSESAHPHDVSCPLPHGLVGQSEHWTALIHDDERFLECLLASCPNPPQKGRQDNGWRATRALLSRCPCGAGGAVQTLGTSGDPPGDNCNLQEASWKEQELPRSPWDLLATITKTPGTQVLCLQLSFSGVLWAVWVGASWDGAPVFDH